MEEEVVPWHVQRAYDHTTVFNMMCINFFVTPLYPNKCTRRAAHF